MNVLQQRPRRQGGSVGNCAGGRGREGGCGGLSHALELVAGRHDARQQCEGPGGSAPSSLLPQTSSLTACLREAVLEQCEDERHEAQERQLQDQLAQSGLEAGAILPVQQLVGILHQLQGRKRGG